MKQTVYMGRGRQKGQKCAPVCTKNPEAFRALASRANILDVQEINAACGLNGEYAEMAAEQEIAAMKPTPILDAFNDELADRSDA